MLPLASLLLVACAHRLPILVVGSNTCWSSTRLLDACSPSLPIPATLHTETFGLDVPFPIRH